MYKTSGSSVTCNKELILMGEMWAFISSYPQVTDAAAALQAWQIQSCGYNFQGWLVWTWDTREQPELWNAISTSGVISQALSPVARPNPCSTEFEETNLDRRE